MKTIKEKIKLINVLRKKIAKLELEIELERLHKKKIYQWYSDLSDSQKRNLVDVQSSYYMDQNYYLWSYLRKEDQESLRKFRKENPDYPVRVRGNEY